MQEVMKAITFTANTGAMLQVVPKPVNAEPGHLVIKMEACAINPGDKFFMARGLPPGSVPTSRYDVWGVSGVGTVLQTGPGVPKGYAGKKVTVYRSLRYSDTMVGTWCQYAHLHYLQCAVLPDDVNMTDYAGSLVNTITPYAFLQQVKEEGDKGIICTAGTSATGIAMLGICLAYHFPLISIVRNESGKRELEALGGENVVVQSDNGFAQQLSETAKRLEATAVFDGVGGEILNTITDCLPNGSTIYCYGYLGGKTPLSFHTSILMRGLTLKGFGNFRTKTVQNPQLLEKALQDISSIIHMPHFKTKTGRQFRLEEIQEALQFAPENGGKTVLRPFA
jgi:NADPH:quinone reductase-like Zn-dependent oxidoreductase